MVYYFSGVEELVGVIMLVLKGIIIKTISYRCLAFMMILGSFAANTSGDLQITGEWQDFFLPWLNIEYGKNQIEISDGRRKMLNEEC